MISEGRLAEIEKSVKVVAQTILTPVPLEVDIKSSDILNMIAEIRRLRGLVGMVESSMIIALEQIAHQRMNDE